MIILSFIARKIKIDVVNSNHFIALGIDTIHAALAIYMIYRYLNHYDISRTLTRSEEKYYQIMLSTEDNTGVNSIVIFIYFLLTLLYRMLYQMFFFETFGVLIKIIVKMVEQSVKFLFISLLFLFTFALIGNCLFNDMSEFKNIFISFNTMYGSALGGFDFGIFASGTTTHETYGRLFMGVYLF
mmetsp:Transcript_21420/g.24612  ORF Transcript_21420/g.24612 Transcript_21420/m.24612 type:complete len:184 (+) Transcript_21420:599-1150(+)